MSTAILCTDCPSFSDAPSTPGFGPVSEMFIKNILKKHIGHILEPVSVGKPLEETLDSLIEAYEECSEYNWDGYGASPIAEDAFNEAWKLIKLFPLSIPMPEISADPAGGISLEWYRERRLTFVVSVSEEKRLDYAGLFGSNTSYGSEHFGDTLPTVILENLRRLYK